MKVLAFTLAAVLCGCAPAAVSQPLDPAGAGEAKPVEAFYGVLGAKTGLRLRVASNGCTRKEDFSFSRSADRAGETSLQFTRNRPDTCQSFAMGSAWIEFSYQELGLTPQSRIRLANPVVAWTGPGD